MPVLFFYPLQCLSIFLRMHHTIYFQQKPLVLTDAITTLTQELLQKPNTAFQDQLNEASVQQMIQEMHDPQVAAGVFLLQDVEALLQAFKKQIRVITAGGGLVHTAANTLLLIFRKGKWDLPKGKLDAGESVEAAALREVTEETGLTTLQLEQPITVTYHTYSEKGELILKESHWFLMKSPQQENLTPQLEEDIERCEWVNPANLDPYLANTHPSIIDVLKEGLNLLPRITF